MSDGGHSALLITVRLSRGRWQYQDLHIKFCCIHCRRHRSYDRNRVLEVQDMFANNWGTVQQELLALLGPRPQILLYPLNCGRQNPHAEMHNSSEFPKPELNQNRFYKKNPMDKTWERLILLSKGCCQMLFCGFLFVNGGSGGNPKFRKKIRKFPSSPSPSSSW